FKAEAIDYINAALDVPGIRRAVHLCRGNYAGMWTARGGYEELARQCFDRAPNVDVWVMEYDDERSGGFEPVGDLPDDKVAGLEVDLVEKNPAWDVYGVGISQPGNALRALNELGLAKEAVEQGHPIVGDRTWLADGQTELADNDWPPLIKGMPPGNGITRPRLHT